VAIINDSRYSPSFKTRANAAATIHLMISMRFLVPKICAVARIAQKSTTLRDSVASFAARGGRTDFPPRWRNSVKLLRLKAKCGARLDGTDIAASKANRDRLNDEYDSRLHPHSICLRRDSPRPRVDIGRMIARLLQ
jgi:hypothetical protein